MQQLGTDAASIPLDVRNAVRAHFERNCDAKGCVGVMRLVFVDQDRGYAVLRCPVCAAELAFSLLSMRVLGREQTSAAERALAEHIPQAHSNVDRFHCPGCQLRYSGYVELTSAR